MGRHGEFARGGKQPFKQRPRPTAILCQLCLAQRPFKPAQAVGLYVSSPISTVMRLACRDRLLTLQGCHPGQRYDGSFRVSKQPTLPSNQFKPLAKRPITTDGQQQLVSGACRCNVKQTRLFFFIRPRRWH